MTRTASHVHSMQLHAQHVHALTSSTKSKIFADSANVKIWWQFDMHMLNMFVLQCLKKHYLIAISISLDTNMYMCMCHNNHESSSLHYARTWTQLYQWILEHALCARTCLFGVKCTLNDPSSASLILHCRVVPLATHVTLMYSLNSNAFFPYWKRNCVQTMETLSRSVAIGTVQFASKDANLKTIITVQPTHDILVCWYRYECCSSKSTRTRTHLSAFHDVKRTCINTSQCTLNNVELSGVFGNVHDCVFLYLNSEHFFDSHCRFLNGINQLGLVRAQMSLSYVAKQI